MSGPWREVIMWEVPLLAVISELVHRCRSPQVGVQQALLHLETKLADFATRTAELDMSGFRLMDFGTRRRFSRDVQYAIVARLKQEPWFIGTSNYDLRAACRLRQWELRRTNGSRRISKSARIWLPVSVLHSPRGWKSTRSNLVLP
jgi:nicotinic acid phosphoribosyltransferase